MALDLERPKDHALSTFLWEMSKRLGGDEFRGGREWRLKRRNLTVEERDAARANKQPHDDQHDAEQDSGADDLDDPPDDEGDGNQPEQ